MASLFLYQEIADPVVAEAAVEGITADRWSMQSPPPVRRLTPTVNTGWFAWNSETPPSFPDWWCQPSEPRWSRRPLVAEGRVKEAASTLGETVESSYWWQPASEPVRSRRPLVRDGCTVAITDPTVFVEQSTTVPPMDSWFVRTSEPRWSRPPLPTMTHTAEPLVLFVTTLDSWWPLASEPRRSRRPLPVNEWTVTAPSTIPNETISLDKWWRPASEPVRTRRPLVTEGITVSITEPSSILIPPVDSWFVRTSEPVRTRAPLVNVGEFVTVATTSLFIVPPLDSWFVKSELPLRPSRQVGEQTINDPLYFDPQFVIPLPLGQESMPTRRLPQTGGTTSVSPFIDEPYSATWNVQVAGPVRVPPRLSAGIVTTETPRVFEISFNEWNRAASEPVRSKPRPVAEGGRAAEPLIDVTPAPDGWHGQQFVMPRAEPQPTGGTTSVTPLYDEPFPATWNVQVVPPMRPRQRLTTGSTTTDTLRTPESAVDSWYVTTSSPVRVKSRPVAEGITLRGVDPLPTLAPDQWHVPASEPVRRVPRRQAEGVAQVDPLVHLTPAVDGWQGQQAMPMRAKPRGSGSTMVTSLHEENYSATWLVQSTEPTRQAAKAHGGITVTEPPQLFEITWDVAAWYRPTSEPVRAKPRLVAQGVAPAVIEPLLIAAPDVSAWYQPTSEPTRTITPRVPVGWSVTIAEPSLFVVPPLDAWYRPTSEPTRTKRPQLLTGGAPWITEPTPIAVPDLATWYTQHPTAPRRSRLFTSAETWYVVPQPVTYAISLVFTRVEVSCPWIQAVEISTPWDQATEISVPWVQTIEVQ